MTSSQRWRRQGLKVAIFAALSLAWFGYSRWKGPADSVLASAIEVGPAWQVIAPPGGLRVERRNQEILVKLPEGATPDLSTPGIHLKDGRLAVPQVELIDQQGASHPLEGTAFVGGARAFYSSTLGTNGVFPSVRIRSDKPFTIPEIAWRCYDP